MYCIIPIEDHLGHYNLDEIDCFQRPIAIVLDNFDRMLANIFIAYAKSMELYAKWTSPIIMRRNLLHILADKMNIEIIPKGKEKFTKFLYNQLDNNYPIIVGVNYYGLYYSNYFLKENYPHWVIVNGYDTQCSLFSILDYTQFMERKFDFDKFVFQEKPFHKLNKDYEKIYSDMDSCFVLSPKEDIKKANFRKMIGDFLRYSLNEMECGTNSVVLQLNDIASMKSKNQVELEKLRILNINKSRKKFVDILVDIMDYFNYDSKLIKQFYLTGSKLIYNWNNYSQFCFLQIDKGSVNAPFSLTPVIKDLEEQMINCLMEFLNFIKASNTNISIESEGKKHKGIQNDYDKVISVLSENEIKFSFFKPKEYNWWEHNNAPMYEILSSKGNNNIKISLVIEIEKKFTVENFQTGFYIINGEESFFVGVDSNDLFCMDKIYVDNFSCYGKLQYKYKLLLEINNKFIELSDVSSNAKKILLKRHFERANEIKVGIVSKTWGTPGLLDITVTDLKYDTK